MPKAKKFTAHKAHNQPYSTNPETARIQEIEQSHMRLTAEVARISTKYHTHLTRRKVSLHKTLKWKQLLEEEQVRWERQLKEELKAEEEMELQVVTKEWIKLTIMEEQNGGEQDEEKSWNGIDEETIEENNSDEVESDPEFEDGNLDASDNEDLFDENGNKIKVEDLIDGMRQIYDRHMQWVANIIKKYEAIDGEEEWESVVEEDEGE